MDFHGNGLTEAEAERLALLVEECGEVIQAAAKVLRHGWDSRHPNAIDGPTNRQQLEKEVGHMRQAVGMMLHAEDLGATAMRDALIKKAGSISQWLHHQRVG